MSSVIETYLKVRGEQYNPGIEEGVFFSTAVEKIAAEKDISVDDVRLIIVAEAAKAREVPMEEMKRAIDTLCDERDSEHEQAEDWNESSFPVMLVLVVIAEEVAEALDRVP